jgi:GTP cyclohydrolase I
VRETAKKLPFICDPVRVTQDDVEDATRTILTDLKD